MSDITRTPGVQGGSPCFRGTRWPTATVVGFGCNVDAVRQAFPHLSREQIEAAIRYERSLRRSFERFVWRKRRRGASVLLGISAEEVENL